MTSSGHVTSSETWPFDSPWALSLSYRPNNSVSPLVSEIASPPPAGIHVDWQERMLKACRRHIDMAIKRKRNDGTYYRKATAPTCITITSTSTRQANQALSSAVSLSLDLKIHDIVWIGCPSKQCVRACHRQWMLMVYAHIDVRRKPRLILTMP